MRREGLRLAGHEIVERCARDRRPCRSARIDDRDACPRVLEQIRVVIRTEERRERHRDRADPLRAEERRDERRRVGQEQRDAIAGRDAARPQAVARTRRERGNVGIGQRVAAVPERRTVGMTRGEVPIDELRREVEHGRA